MRRWIPVLWLAFGLFLTAFAVFEMAKHLGWTVVLACVGLALPALGVGVPILHRVVSQPVLPILVLATFTLLPGTTDQTAPGFTLGLTWLARLSFLRALDAFQRARV